MDVRRVTVSNEQRITVITKVSDLRRRSQEGISVYIDTRRGDYGPEFAAIGGLGANDSWLMQRVERWDYRRGEILFDCDLKLRVSYPRDTATFDIARRCLSGPERIRVAVSLSGHDWAPRNKTFYPSVVR